MIYKTTNKKRVLHIITRLIPGGADENTIYTVSGLDKNRFLVDLMVGEEYDSSYAGLPVDAFMVNKQLSRNIHPLKDALAFISIYKLIKQKRYDIVHTHTAKAGILGRFAARCANVPVIVHTLHGSTFHSQLHPPARFIFRLLERLGEKVSAKLITVGDDLRERYLSAKIGKPEKYITIRSGFDVSKFDLDSYTLKKDRARLRNELGTPVRQPVIGTVARLEPRKGLGFLISLAERLVRSNHNVHFYIAGDGPDYAALKEKIESKNLSDMITLLGYRDDVESVLASIDLFVLTSLWEGLPRVLVQAAMVGRPIVCFDVEGAKEIVYDGFNGYIVPIGDIDALTEKVRYLLDQETLLRVMGDRSKSIDPSSWSKEVMISQIETLYMETGCG
ncbi:glycosyltransferase [candidate division KSB1 bacterium]|nr:glycosyltransferase [candidate division KSB1 bacterium]